MKKQKINYIEKPNDDREIYSVLNPIVSKWFNQYMIEKISLYLLLPEVGKPFAHFLLF